MLKIILKDNVYESGGIKILNEAGEDILQDICIKELRFKPLTAKDPVVEVTMEVYLRGAEIEVDGNIKVIEAERVTPDESK